MSDARVAGSVAGGAALAAGSAALAGASGALLARFAAYPLEMRRTIAAARGHQAVKALSVSDHYIGVQTACLDSFIYFGCNYGLYTVLESMYRRRIGASAQQVLPAVSALAIGMLSDAITLIVDTPIETICMRLAAAQGKESIWDIASSIFKNGGIWGYWKGMGTTLSYSPLRQAIIFLVYERLKLASLVMNSALSSFEAFSFGAAGEAVATCVIYPLFYIRIKQATTTQKDDKKDTTTTLLSLIYREVQQHGILQVYSGLWEEVVASAGKGALRFLIKEWLQRFWMSALGAIMI